MGVGLSQRLVPDELWALVAPLLPSFASRPQGGGTAPCDERAVFTAVVYVLTSGCAWRHLPETFGVSPATAHRRFSAWMVSLVVVYGISGWECAGVCPGRTSTGEHRSLNRRRAIA
ncbi:transposase [Streptomyces sp. NPDC088560]|uniref:transposase n=1 Tax=Streptomyces sp. NPDC088560 TaxID=3365868 RepID=UPI00380CB79A